MVYLGFDKTFDSVCVRFLHTQNFLDKADD